MKSNKELVYDFIHKCSDSISSQDSQGVSTVYLSEKLAMQRTNISSILNTLVKEKRIEKVNGRPVLYRIPNIQSDTKEKSCFKSLIGHNGSLKNAVQLAKAAILYPHQSLHTLISGPKGCGKSTFAFTMVKFAIESGVIDQDAPYVKFNCRDHNHQQDQIKTLLFGEHGNLKNCAIQEAQHGILFIDHINQMPADARIALFEWLASESSLDHDVMMICGYESPDMNLDEALQNRFSIKIALPSLASRNKEERLAFIQSFFTSEAMKMKRLIHINSELLRCVLLYTCEGNLRQLKTDIVIGCANAYVREFNIDQERLHVFMNDFPNYVRRGFLSYRKYRSEIEQLIPQNYSYSFSSENMKKVADKTSIVVSVYDEIDRKAAQLRERGILEEDINTIVGVEIEHEFKSYANHLVNQDINKSTLTKIVDAKIISLVETFLENTSKELNRIYPVSVFYGLCLHLSATLERASKVQRLSNSQIMEMVEKHQEEYAICMKFASQIEKLFNVRLPIDEVIFITMFISDKRQEAMNEKKPVVLVALHGNQSASSMVEVINMMVKAENTFAYDLRMDKDMQEAYEELKTKMLEIHQGKGILMLYDMGSLKTMAEMIMVETGIEVKMIEIPATLIGLDCSRKAAGAQSLEVVYESVMESYEQSFSMMKQSYQRVSGHPIIITLCMSGQGGAIQMKEYLEKNMELGDVKVLPYAMSDRELLLSEINQLRKSQEILCVIGTYDPKLFNIPFVSITKLFETKVSHLTALLHSDFPQESVDYTMIYEYLKEQLTNFDEGKIKKHLPKLIKEIRRINKGLSQDQELGLFMHIACSVHRLASEGVQLHNTQSDTILNKNKRLYNELKEVVHPIEKAYKISFNDDELAYIISMIKQI